MGQLANDVRAQIEAKLGERFEAVRGGAGGKAACGDA